MREGKLGHITSVLPFLCLQQTSLINEIRVHTVHVLRVRVHLGTKEMRKLTQGFILPAT